MFFRNVGVILVQLFLLLDKFRELSKHRKIEILIFLELVLESFQLRFSSVDVVCDLPAEFVKLMFCKVALLACSHS